MKNEPGKAVYDHDLRLEAYRFRRCSFPKHFHEYYVIGYIEDGQGLLICRDVQYALKKGDIILYNPGDLHSCTERGAPPDYWGLHIPRETMLDLTGELTGRRTPPVFSQNVLSDPEAAWDFRTLHRQIMSGSREFGKEERLLLLLSRLLRLCGQPLETPPPAGREAVERARAFMEEHYGERISLERIAGEAGLSKSALLRAFAREKGVTPYGYLENLRISRAKKLLEQGVSPAEAALWTGFSDQSHFTNYFSRFLGLSPGAYREIFSDKERISHEK
nr:AraC family transcriptional regulator [uncultured Oscillibacter sp.]